MRRLFASVVVAVSYDERASERVRSSVRSFVHSLARARSGARARTQLNVVVALFSLTHIYIYTCININVWRVPSLSRTFHFPMHASLSLVRTHTHME